MDAQGSTEKPTRVSNAAAAHNVQRSFLESNSFKWSIGAPFRAIFWLVDWKKEVNHWVSACQTTSVGRNWLNRVLVQLLFAFLSPNYSWRILFHMPVCELLSTSWKRSTMIWKQPGCHTRVALVTAGIKIAVAFWLLHIGVQQSLIFLITVLSVQL